MSTNEFFEYRKNRDLCLKSICLIVHYAENVLIFEDMDSFPEELRESIRFLLEFLEWGKDISCYRSLHNLANNTATLEDFQKIADSKNTYKEMIILRLSNKTMDFYEEKKKEDIEFEDIP